MRDLKNSDTGFVCLTDSATRSQTRQSWINASLIARAMMAGYAALIAGALLAPSAHAGTIPKGVTEAAEFTTNAPSGSTNDNTYVSEIGAAPPFNTSLINVIRTSSGGVDTIELQLYTGFAADLGSGDCFGSGSNKVCANAADIDLTVGGVDYGLALGKQAIANGGVSAGLYTTSVAGWTTSQQIWGQTSHTNSGQTFTFGGGWASCNAGCPGSNAYNQSNVEVKSGNTKVSGSTVVVGTGSNATGQYIDVTLSGSATNTTISNLFNGDLNIFWGTADCANDPIAGVDLATTTGHTGAAPEPASFVILLGGLAAIVAVRRRLAVGA